MGLEAGIARAVHDGTQEHRLEALVVILRIIGQVPVRLADLVRSGDSSANVALMPGDVIIIPESMF